MEEGMFYNPHFYEFFLFLSPWNNFLVFLFKVFSHFSLKLLYFLTPFLFFIQRKLSIHSVRKNKTYFLSLKKMQIFSFWSEFAKLIAKVSRRNSLILERISKITLKLFSELRGPRNCKEICQFIFFIFYDLHKYIYWFENWLNSHEFVQSKNDK